MGNVREVIPVGDRIWVNTAGTGNNILEQCAIWVERNPISENIRPGDMIWWQMGTALWTPQDYRGPRFGGRDEGLGTLWDISIPKLGYSGASHPARKMIDRAYSLTEIDIILSDIILSIIMPCGDHHRWSPHLFLGPSLDLTSGTRLRYNTHRRRPWIDSRRWRFTCR